MNVFRTRCLLASIIVVTFAVILSSAGTAFAADGYITGTVTGAGVGPLEGQWVTANIDHGDWWEPVSSASTLADGSYTLGGLAPGSYFVQFQGNSDWLNEIYDDVHLWAEATPVDVTSEEYTSGISAELDPASHIAGTVTDGTNPIQGIQVVPAQWQDQGDGNGYWMHMWWASATTGADGTYNMGGLQPGNYRMFFEDGSGAWAYEAWNDKLCVPLGDDIGIGPGVTAWGHNAVLAPAGSISGRVTSDGSTGLADVQVNVAVFDLESGLWEEIRGSSTDADGYYTVGGLPAGTFAVRFFDSEGQWLQEYYNDQRTWENSEGVDVTSGVDTPDIDAVLDPASHIFGTVTGAGGAGPLANVSVVPAEWQDDGEGGGWWNQRWDLSQFTEADGTYDIGGLQPATYRLMFFDENGLWATEYFDDAMTVTEGQDIALDVGGNFEANAELAVGGHITGRVTSDGVNGIANVTVGAGPFDVDSEFYEHIAWAQTDENGYYDLAGMPAGTFRVQFWDDSGNWLTEYYDDVQDWHDATDVTLDVGGTAADINAVLQPALHIRGTITGAGGAGPLESIQVMPLEWQDDGEGGGWWNQRWDLSVWTGADGTYDIGGLLPNTYRLWIQDNNGQWATEYFDNAISPLWGTDIDLSLGDAEANAELAPAGHITGRVTSDGVSGIEGVWVGAGPFDPNTGNYEHIAWAQTDAEGYYDLAGMPAGEFRVQFWDETGTWRQEYYDNVGDSLDATDITVAEGATVPNINAELEAASHIRGTVTGAGGAGPLSGVSVVPLQWMDDGEGGGWWEQLWWMGVQTDVDGAYDIGGLDPMNYRLMFRDEWSGQWAAEYYDNAICAEWATDIDLSAGGDFEANAELAPAAHITGRVTSDGVNGIANATIAAGPFDPDTGMYEHIAWAQADADGYYDMTGLPAGTFKVEFWDESGEYLGEFYDNTRNWDEAIGVTLAEGATEPDIDAVLAQACSISGTVTGNGGSLGPNGGDAVPMQWMDDGEGGGWWEQLWMNPGGINPDGSYRIGGLEPGTYRVGFFADGAVWATEFWDNARSVTLADDITLTESEQRTGVDADLATSGKITGRVTSDGTTGIENITIIGAVFDPATEMWDEYWYTQTDADGNYSLEGLSAGLVGVQFFDGGGTWIGEYYNDVSDWHDATAVNVTTGGTTPNINAVLAPSAHIRGTVTGEGEGPLDGIGVEVFSFNGEWWDWAGSVNTGPDGTYDVNGLDAGVYRVWFSDWNWPRTWGAEAWDDLGSWMWGTDIELAASESRDGIDAELARAGTISGTVTGGGNPLTNVDIAVGPYDAATENWDGWWGYAEVNPDGTYTVTGLKPGVPYRIMAWDVDNVYAPMFFDGGTEDYLTGTDVYVESDTDTVCDFDLNMGSTIRGRVTNEASEPLADIPIFLYRPGMDGWNDFWASFQGQWASTDADGYYEVGGLTPGEYRIGFGDYSEMYAGEFYNDAPTLTTGDTITVDTYAQVIEDIDAVLSVGGSIEGYVRDGEGNPIANTVAVQAVVRPDAGDPGRFEELGIGNVSTDEDGYYRITGLRPQDEVLVHAWGWTEPWVEEWYEESEFADGATGIHVTSGATTPAINFTLESAGSISGTITLARPSDGYDGIVVNAYQLVDHGDWVEWVWRGGPWGQLSETGEWTIEGLPAGDYAIEVGDDRGIYAMEYYNNSPTMLGADPIAVVGGQNTHIDIALALAGHVTGTVTHGATPLEGIYVSASLWDAGLSEWISVGGYGAWTEADGTYSLPLAPGTYRVEFASWPGFQYAPQFWPGMPTAALGQDVVVAAEGVVSGIDADMTLPASLTITTENEAADPLGGIDVTLYYNAGAAGWQPIQSGTTELGTWLAEGLLPGSYRLHFDDPTNAYIDCYYDGAPDLSSANTIVLAEGADDGVTQVLIENAVVDTTPPVSTASGLPSSTWSTANVTVTLSATDDLAGVDAIYYTINGGATQVYASPIVFSTEGVTEFEYWAVDLAGPPNTETAHEATIRIDKTVPTADDDAVAEYTDSATIHLTGADAAPGSGVASIQYSLDGAPWVSDPGATMSLVIETLGTHTLSYKSVDVAGNSSTVHDVVFAATRTIPVEETPIAGANRFDTAIAVSEAAFPDGADWVVIATGRNWPDALGGSALAGALDGPILLTDTTILPEAVADEIERLGATNAVILGGTAAVGANVETSLNILLGSANVERIAGADRYLTADAVGARTIDEFGAGFDGTAFVVTGANYPDALAAAPLAAGLHWPLFLTRVTGISASTETAMDGVSSVLVLGGTAAVPAAIENNLNAMYGNDNVDRLAGADRYASAIVIASYGVDHGLRWDRLALATGQKFPDALAGGVMQGRDGSVLLLTKSETLYAGVATVLRDNSDVIGEVRYLGGAAAVSQSVRDEVAAILE